jgi:microcystin-dependent protein
MARNLIFLITFFSLQVFATVTNVMPSGAILAFAGTTCPSGYLPEDGSSYLRTGIYANLFTAIGTTYGALDGSHFSVPNAKGVFQRGAGSQTISGIAYTGTQGTSQYDTFQGHYHNIYDPGHAHSYTGFPGGTISFYYAGGTSGPLIGGGTTGGNVTGVLAQAASNDGTNGVPRISAETHPANIVVLYCIKL